jgi:agmatinase
MALEDAKRETDLAFTRPGLKGPAFENAFAGATSFLRRRYTKDLTGVDLAVTGIPFDQGVTHRPGARFGPRAVREASSLQPFDPPYGWGFDPLSDFAVADFGDMAFDYARTADFPAAVTAHVGGILDAGAGTLGAWGRSLCDAAHPRGPCGPVRASGRDPVRCPFRSLAGR